VLWGVPATRVPFISFIPSQKALPDLYPTLNRRTTERTFAHFFFFVITV
jgi:hypothetical protein